MMLLLNWCSLACILLLMPRRRPCCMAVCSDPRCWAGCAAGGWVSAGLIFFFSSRRRHTRCLSDWSSDVCSSDLSRRRHTRCLSDWSSDVCSSDLLKTSNTAAPEGGNDLARLRTPFGTRRFEWVNGKLMQRSMVTDNLEWNVSQVLDSVTPGSTNYNEKARLAKTR